MAKYYFTIQLMSPRPRIRARHLANGQWLPPKGLGSNVKLRASGQTEPMTWTFEHDGRRHDGQPQTSPTRQLPGASTQHRVYSLYYAQGLIFTVPFDATLRAVGDGIDHPVSDTSDSSDSDSNDDSNADWAELSFCPKPHDNTYMSLAQSDRERQRLLVQRPDQRWAAYFLPDRYQSLPEHRTQNQRYGGLAGHLPLLIGLIALALPIDRWLQLIPMIICNPLHGTGSWQVPAGLEGTVPRGSGWQDTRGVVVTVYRPAEQAGGSASELRAYERGERGPIWA